MKKITCFLFILLVSELVWGNADNQFKLSRFLMDTYVTVFVQDAQAEKAERACKKTLDRMEELNDKFNNLNPDSPIYQFNHSGLPIEDPEILSVISEALRIAKLTEGAFDPTIYPLIRLWGFYDKKYRVPEPEEIKAALQNVGFRYLVLEKDRLTKTNSSVMIDLGGIAKGFCVDEGIKILKAEGIVYALIDAGGDIYALGNKVPVPWRVGVRNPRESGVLGYLEVADTSVLGSGDYERFFIKEGKRYHHILSPFTGYPTESLAGITVIHPSTMIADAMATALFVLGREKGLECSTSISGLKVIMVDPELKLFYSKNMNDDVHPVPKL